MLAVPEEMIGHCRISGVAQDVVDDSGSVQVNQKLNLSLSETYERTVFPHPATIH
jgi:hypothetical protein